MKQNTQILDRYPGIRPFVKGEEKLFFGRRQETADLLSLVKTRKLVVLFAKSGIGKSSLINAGLSPKLTEDGFFPITVRFQNTDLSPLEIMDRVLSEFLDTTKLAQFDVPESAHLWQKIKACHFGEVGKPSATPLFIFDQFEELFNHKPENRTEFTRQLADLVENRLPEAAQEILQSTLRSQRTPEMLAYFTPANVHFLCAIRSDRLHELNEMTTAIPAVLTTGNRFELHPLNRFSAREAIEEPAKLVGNFNSPTFNYEATTLEDILTNLSTKKADEIESFQLQILCGEIEKKVRLLKNPTDSIVVTPDYLGGSEGIKAILNGYYENQIRAVADPVAQKQARILVEDQLIADRKRIGVAVETVNLPKELVDKLLESRIIRISNTHLGDVFEISHDTLVEPIVKSRNERRLREETERLAIERAAQTKEFAEQKARLDHERQLREQAEIAQKEAENAKNEAFLEKIKAERAARRANWTSITSIILLVSSLIFGYLNLIQERNSYLKQGDFLQKQKQFREAANVYNRLLGKEILDFTNYDRDSVQRAVARMEHLDSIKQVVIEGDSLYFDGNYRLALDKYRDAQQRKYDGMAERIQRTEQILRLSFDVFNRKAETFYSLWLADQTDEMASEQACFYIQKALNLRPEDADLLGRSQVLGCK
jgi:hypothetical protein